MSEAWRGSVYQSKVAPIPVLPTDPGHPPTVLGRLLTHLLRLTDPQLPAAFVTRLLNRVGVEGLLFTAPPAWAGTK